MTAQLTTRLRTKLRCISHRGCSRQGFCWTASQRSHIGASPISLPSSVTCELASAPPGLLFSGPSGAKRLQLPAGILAHVDKQAADKLVSPTGAQVLSFSCDDAKSRENRSQWGLTRTRAANVVQGLSQGFSLPVRLVGVGFRATLEPVQTPVNTELQAGLSDKQLLILRLGYPRPLRFALPLTITCTLVSPTEIELHGQDNEELGQFAASIRRWRKPEPYNGKGVFIGKEQIRKKEVRKK